MARALEEFKFGVRQGRPKYPWKKWTDGRTWEVLKGTDYTCTSGSLVVYLYHKARECDMTVQTSIVKGIGRKKERVVFRFRPKGEDVEQAPAKRKLKRRQR